MQGPQIILKGATTHAAKVSDTPLGTIRSIEHPVQHLEDLAESLALAIADHRKRLADIQGQVGAAFEYSRRLSNLLHRQCEIESALALRKSQVSSHLEAQAPDELPGANLAAGLDPTCAACG